MTCGFELEVPKLLGLSITLEHWEVGFLGPKSMQNLSGGASFASLGPFVGVSVSGLRAPVPTGTLVTSVFLSQVARARGGRRQWQESQEGASKRQMTRGCGGSEMPRNAREEQTNFLF